MKKISIIVIIVIVVLVGCLLLNSNIIKPNIAKLDISSPENIVTKIEAEVYSTSTPVDTYATIRWGEQGTYRNKDVSAMGVYLNGTDQKLLNFF